MRYDKYTLKLDGTMLTVCGDTHLLFSIDLRRCEPRSGLYRVMVEVANRNDMHQGAQSAFGRALDALLVPVVMDEEHTGEHRLRLDRWDVDNVAKRFHEEASLYINQPNQR
jgi:hypothetical protein